MNKYRKLKILIILIICFMNTLCFSLLNNDTIADEKKLNVGCLYFKNIFEKNSKGEFSGYAKDYLDELEKKSNYKFNIILGEEDILKEKLKRGEIDYIFLGRKKNLDLKEFAFSEREVGVSNAKMYVKTDKDVYYNDYKNFNNYKVGIDSDMIEEKFKQYEKKYKFKTTIIKFDNYKQTEKALNNGEVDMIVSEQMNGNNSYKLVGTFSMSPLYVYSLKNTQRIQIFNELQRELYKENTSIITKLNNRYYENVKLNSPLFTREEGEYLKSAKPVSIAVKGYKPFVWKEKNGELKGIYINVLNRLSEQLKVDFNYILVDENDIEKNVLAKYKYYVYSEDYIKNYKSIENNKAVIFDMPCVYIKIRNKDINLKRLQSIGIEQKNYSLEVENKFSTDLKNTQIVKFKRTIDIVNAVDSNDIETAILKEMEIPYLFRLQEFDDLTTVKNNDFIGKLIIETNEKNNILFNCIKKELDFLDRETLYNESDKNLDTFKMDFNEILNKYKQEIFILMLIVIVIILLTYVDQRKKMLLKIEKSRKRAEKANNAKSLFLANMSHDIRTPLNAIIGFIDLALDEVKDNKSIEYFTKIKQSGLYLLTLLNDILEMSRIESGKVILEENPVNTRILSQEIFEIIAPHATAKQITFYFDCNNLKYDYQYIDEIRVKQIIINVLNNAIKYTKSGGYVKYTVENIYKENNKIYTRHIIEDNGVGISDDFKNKLFDAFEKEKNSESKKEGGTGLGLAITKKLLDLMEGSIYVKSEVNKGSIFTIDIPTVVISKEKFITLKNKGLIKKHNVFENKFDLSKLENIKIIVAEDNDINAKIACKILDNLKISSVRVKNGQEVINLLKENNNYSLILMDVRMPILDGIEATKLIRNSRDIKTREIPIVGLSANAFYEDILTAKKAGMNDYISKPIDLEKFKKILMKNLNMQKETK